MNEVKEKGMAGIIIELEDGIITIYHSEHPGISLLQWEGSGNDWNTMWELFHKLANKE